MRANHGHGLLTYARGMSVSQALVTQVESWISQDPDPVTQRELRDLLLAAQSDHAALFELQDAFSAPLEFGTAGLRGPLGAGPNRINRVTVLQAAAGLAAYLIGQGLKAQPVTIGFDGRHNSEVFARDTAEVLAGAGLKPMLFSHVVPTPVLAYSIRHQKACAGVMVTASHNPPQDNGYKVYLGDGRQIVSPADQQISELISKISDVSKLNRITEYQTIDRNVIDDYVSCTSDLLKSGPTSETQRLEVTSVYTAMHGVGWQTFREVVAAAGFREAIAVPEQRDPDPEFPTVAFPNPEEKGALDLAIALAESSNAQLLIANDPDADRLAIALPDSNDKWTPLRGDQIGSLLGWWIVERATLSNQELIGTYGSSIVSSMMLEQIAQAANLPYVNTLTGFKWVSRVPNLVYGYEEALGYCVDPKNVSDKDGISAALLFLELVTHLQSFGKSCWNILDDLALAHGLHATDQVSVRVTDLSQVGNVMNNLRTNPPSEFGGLKVKQIDDLTTGFANLPKTNAVVFQLAGDDDVAKARVIIRPSGTEPKIKCYLEVVVRNSDLVEAQLIADNELAALARDAQPLLTGGN